MAAMAREPACGRGGGKSPATGCLAESLAPDVTANYHDPRLEDMRRTHTHGPFRRVG